MKTSTFLLIAVVFTFVIALTVYNFTLRASYLKGDYKNPFYGLMYTEIPTASKVKIESSNGFQLRIIKGQKDGIYFSERAKGHFTFTVKQNSLQLGLTEESKSKGFIIYSDDLILVRSALNELQLSPYYNSENNSHDYPTGRVNISGFVQPAMHIETGTGSIVSLDSLQIGELTVRIGHEEGGKGGLTIEQGKYKSAQFNVLGKSSLQLFNPEIIKTSYNLSKAASVTLNGKALNDIK